MKGLYYYKLQSPYPEDVTKNCKLTINEIDSNFLSLKDEDIKSAEFDREAKTLVLTRNNGEKLFVDLSDVTYDLNVSADCSESGNSLTISYDGKNGKQTVVFDRIVTVDNLMSIIGSDILTKVITDGTLKGYGTLSSPLGLNGIEKTGLYAPVKAKLDLTNGDKLPEVAKLGTRYATVEYVNDYGYLYNGNGLNKIIESLAAEGKGWRVPSKADWDGLLNSIEPCEYQNHNSAKCHVELGKVSGKYLKSECGWLGQPDCECTVTKPLTGCSIDEMVVDNTDEYVEDYDGDDSETPVEKPETPSGVDKYGMCILPSGMVYLDAYDRPQADGFKAMSTFWTTSHVYNDVEQDLYVKQLFYKKGGVIQEAECPLPFYSVRLVKDYDGSNYFDSEYIDGIIYKTILFPEIGQIWLASNYAKKEGFIAAGEGQSDAEYAEVNNGEVIERRKVVFINEWNGKYWDKKLLHEGDTVVVENPCLNDGSFAEIQYCWRVNEEGDEQCDTLTINHEAQNNLEYRVYTVNGCNQDLVNTDDLAIERIVKLILPVIIQEKEERISADTELWDALNEEVSARTEAIEELQKAIEDETIARESADTVLWNALSAETKERIAADIALLVKINAESERAQAEEKDIRDTLNAEISRAISAETMLDVKIDNEIERAKAEEQLLSERLSAETAARIEGDEALDNKIDEEISKVISAETALNEKIDAEIERAQQAEKEIDNQLIDATKEYELAAVKEDGTANLVLDAKDGTDEHSVKIIFNADFGEI